MKFGDLPDGALFTLPLWRDPQWQAARRADVGGVPESGVTLRKVDGGAVVELSAEPDDIGKRVGVKGGWAIQTVEQVHAN
jgi:hypothetical protein